MTSRLYPHFDERFELVERPSQGLLLDLESGNFYRLNASATCICSEIRRGASHAECVGVVSRRFQIDSRHAARDVDSVANLLRAESRREPSDNPLHFEWSGDIATMHWDGTATLRIDAGSSDLPVEWIDGGRYTPYQGLLWAAPHILALCGVHVLHASSVARDDGVLAFTGSSGAGKTTMAHTFAAHGAELVSEDLLVVDGADAHGRVYRHGERGIRAWVEARVASLDRGTPIHGRELASVIRGESLPLRELMFLGARHSGGPVLERTLLDPIDAMGRVLENSFAELGTRDVFRRGLRQGEALVASVAMSACSAPDGLDALTLAVRQLQNPVARSQV